MAMIASLLDKARSAEIVIGAGNTIAATEKIWAKPNTHVFFVVYNNDTKDHVVRIPSGEFEPAEGFIPPAKKHPMALAIHWAAVAAGDVEVIKLKVRSGDHFGAGNWTYKYNVYSADDIFGTDEKKLDPQIEINN